MLKTHHRFAALLAALAMVAALLAGCSSAGRTPPGSAAESSTPEQSAAQPQPEAEQEDEPAPEEIPAEPEESSQSEEPEAMAMSAEFAEFAALDSTRKDWGPGGPVDELNRSQGSLAYNKLYSKYNATFLEEDSDKIYLTFDQGYENGYTPAFLDALKEHNVKGVFFLTGDYVRRQPELIQRMIDEGHVLGSHSDQHPDMPSLPLEEVWEDTATLHNMVVEQFHYEPKLYRFPAGAFNEQTLALVQKAGYRSVFWSFAYRDWLVDDQPDPEEALQKILDSAHPGGIYLLHTVSETNSKIIGDVIEGFQALGYEIGDPNDLIR